MKSSRPPTMPASPWCLPVRGISGTEVSSPGRRSSAATGYPSLLLQEKLDCPVKFTAGPATSGRTRLPGNDETDLNRAGDPLFELLLRRGADLAGGKFTVLEQHQCRDRHNAELGRSAWIFIDVELDDFYLAVERFGNFFQRRRDHAAGPAPFRPEIHHHGFGRFKDVLFERCVRHFFDHGKTSLSSRKMAGRRKYERRLPASRPFHRSVN